MGCMHAPFISQKHFQCPEDLLGLRSNQCGSVRLFTMHMLPHQVFLLPFNHCFLLLTAICYTYIHLLIWNLEFGIWKKWKMCTPKQHIEDIRRTKFSIGGPPNPLTEDLHQAVRNLSAELYTKDVHFLMELIQAWTPILLHFLSASPSHPPCSSISTECWR